MPDITMCLGEGCSRKNKCYRYTAKESDMQSFFAETPKKPCKEFWDNGGYRNAKEKETKKAR